jgi:hypothetical protein
VLINSVLTSLTMFMLPFFEVQKRVLEKIDYYRSQFFFGRTIVKKRSIDLLNGISFASLEIRVVWGCKT